MLGSTTESKTFVITENVPLKKCGSNLKSEPMTRAVRSLKKCQNQQTDIKVHQGRFTVSLVFLLSPGAKFYKTRCHVNHPLMSTFAEISFKSATLKPPGEYIFNCNMIDDEIGIVSFDNFELLINCKFRRQPKEITPGLF